MKFSYHFYFYHKQFSTLPIQLTAIAFVMIQFIIVDVFIFLIFFSFFLLLQCIVEKLIAEGLNLSIMTTIVSHLLPQISTDMLVIGKRKFESRTSSAAID